MKIVRKTQTAFKQESVAAGTGKVTVWSKFMTMADATKVSLDIYPESNNMPSGTVLTTYFYKNGVVIGSDTDTLGAVTKENWSSVVHTHANSFKADGIKVKADLDQDASNVYTATLEVTAYAETDIQTVNLAGVLADVSSVVGDSVAAGETINVALQLKDALDSDIATPMVVRVWLSSDDAGETPAAAGTSVAIGTDGSIIETLTAATSFDILSEADGDIDIDVVHDAAESLYLNVAIPGQKIHTSLALTWS